jgi:hypothetical protein
MGWNVRAQEWIRTPRVRTPRSASSSSPARSARRGKSTRVGHVVARPTSPLVSSRLTASLAPGTARASGLVVAGTTRASGFEGAPTPRTGALLHELLRFEGDPHSRARQRVAAVRKKPPARLAASTHDYRYDVTACRPTYEVVRGPLRLRSDCEVSVHMTRDSPAARVLCANCAKCMRDASNRHACGVRLAGVGVC